MEDTRFTLGQEKSNETFSGILSNGRYKIQNKPKKRAIKHS
jgi:hypothetical protein